MKDNTIYDDDSIQSLDPRSHVRLRAGMYLGDTSNPTQLLIEVFSNALDEHNLGHGNRIDVTVYDDDSCSVTDYGQGFPVNVQRDDGKTVLQASFDEMNTSGKYSDDGVYGGTSLGTNGVGCKATTFTSLYLTVKSYRVQDKKYEEVTFKDGIFKNRKVGKWTESYSGTTVKFKPDPQFFESAKFDTNYLKKLFDNITCLCPELVITYEDKDGTIEFSHPSGVSDIVELYATDNQYDLLTDDILFFRKAEDDYSLTCGLGYVDTHSSNIVAYVNYGLTEQGPHITSLKSTLTRVMNKWAREQGFLSEKDKNIDGDSLQEGLVLAFNLVAPGISYDAQTKGKVVSKEFVPFLTRVFGEQLEIWLDNNPEYGKNIVEKALLARRAAEAAKKAREAVRSKTAKKEKLFKLPTTLVDAWTKDRSKAELLVCEGKSAMSGLVAARDSETQAIYGVRGMMISARKSTSEKLLQNQEVNNLILALGLDIDTSTNKLIYDVDKLRYDKIIACADADPAGSAIENLLFNILWYLCPELIKNGHVYSAIPPLFRVITKSNEYIYLKDGDALKSYQEKNKDKVKSISREKGLGEMDSEELSDTLLSPDTRNIVQLSVQDAEQTENIFEMLYGKNVQPRVEYILQHAEEVDVDYE